MIFAYFGPETFLPLTSVIAGVVGVVLMFGRNTLRVLRLMLGRALGRDRAESPAPSATPAPHAGAKPTALERRRAQAAGRRSGTEEGQSHS